MLVDGRLACALGRVCRGDIFMVTGLVSLGGAIFKVIYGSTYKA